jgi:hypothetical protein
MLRRNELVRGGEERELMATLSTAQMITAVRDTFGEDSTTASQVTDTQILAFLNRRMRELCADSNVLVSGWTASTVNGQQQYSVPPEYTSVEKIDLYRTTLDLAKWELDKVSLRQIDVTKPTGTPVRFAVWGLNVSGDNSPAFWLDPIPSGSGTNDLICYGRQLPKVLVSGGQGPEVRDRWVDAVVDGAVGLVYRRLAEGSRESIALADRYEQIWQDHKRAGLEYITLDLYSPGMPRDTMGYTSGRRG